MHDSIGTLNTLTIDRGTRINNASPHFAFVLASFIAVVWETQHCQAPKLG
jgi:hypothetical protein